MKHVRPGRALAGKNSPVGLILCNGALPADRKDKLPTVAELQARGGVAGQPPEPAGFSTISIISVSAMSRHMR